MTTPTKKYSLARHRATTRSKALRRRGMTLSRVRRKALRRSAMRAFRCWQHLTRCFAFFHRRSRGCLSSRFRTLRRLFGSAFLALWLPAVAQAETFTVTSSSDLSDPADGQTTLREAIALANETPGPDLIDFAEELSGAVLTLTQGELAISDELTIDASDLAEAPVIDADEKSRVMHFTAAEGDLSLTKLTLRNGSTDGDGGGILFASSGTLSVTRSTLSGNDAYSGGGISTDSGSVAVSESTLNGNQAIGYYGYGGGINSGGGGTLTVINSTVSENSTEGGGGGINTLGGSLTLTNSTISGNSAEGSGGGIYTIRGSLTVTNSTLSGNSAEGSGGGIVMRLGSLTLKNSIIAGNLDNGTAPDVSIEGFWGFFPDLRISYSLIGDSTGAGLDRAIVNHENLIDVDPLLEPLADNGGPTQTHALGIGSPAIDKGNATGLDQRGFPRLDDPSVPNSVAGSDIGSFEQQRNFIVVTEAGDLTDDDVSEGNLTLREAITLANGDPNLSRVFFRPDLDGETITLTQGELTISDSLILSTLNLEQELIIDADQKSRVMNFIATEGNLQLTGLTLRNGKTEQDGGTIRFASNGVLTVTQSTLSDNVAANGGGISSDFGEVILTRSTLSGNNASSGGGISSGSGAVRVSESTLTRNSSEFGGGISSDSGEIILTRSTLSGNNASSGGGISSGSGAVRVSESTLTRNSSEFGGGISSDSGEIILTRSTLSENSASSGGGIYTSSGTVRVSESTVSRNSSEGGSGGGIFSDFGQVIVTLSMLSENTAETGGGIFADSGEVVLTRSTLSGNAASSGGGIYTSSGAVRVSESALSRNSSDGGSGGGIFSDFGQVIVTLSTLSENTAESGGGIFADSGEVVLTRSTLSGNAASYGGGISSGSGAVRVSESTLTSNSSEVGGGGLKCSGPLILTNSIVAGNSDTSGTAPDVSAPADPSKNLEVSHSLIGDRSGAGLDQAKVNLNNLIDVDPLLEPLADNGGFTQTHALKAGSPALDQGNATSSDQRGRGQSDDPDLANAADGNGSDIGAFEREVALLVSEAGDLTDGNFSAGHLTLREAITLANENGGIDEIGFRNDLSGEVITLTQGELVISEELSIDASGLAEAPVINGGNGGSIFGISGSRVMKFTAAEGDLSLTNLTLRNGRTKYRGGGILFESRGLLTLTNSTLSGNVASAPAIEFPGGTHGPGSYSTSNGGGISARGAVTLVNSTVSGNSAYGFYSWGGGISAGGAVTLVNSTVSGNSVGGHYEYGGGIDAGVVSMTNSTVSGNSGGGIRIGSPFGSLTLTNSIIAGNSSRDVSTESIWGIFPDLRISYSLIGNSTGLGLDQAIINHENLIDVDPLLEPLADNGGPTRTHALRAGSPAIDQGNATGLDQRGFPRVDDRLIVNATGGNGSDIGAFERPISPNAQILESSLLGHGLPADSDLTEDLNNDGVSLLMAYALALDPHANLSGSMPVPVINGDSMSLSFHAASPGITYTVETSTNLAHWTTEGVVWSETGTEGRRTASVERHNQRLFLRLLVSVTD